MGMSKGLGSEGVLVVVREAAEATRGDQKLGRKAF